MNKVMLMGRLVREPEVRYTSTDTYSMAIARYTLAVDRKKTSKEEQAQTDFISCVAFGKQGEFAEKYLTKGMKIAIEGRIQTGSYTNKEGAKVYTTDIVVEAHEFCESRNDGGSSAPAQKTTNTKSKSSSYSKGLASIDFPIDEELPFAKVR